MDQASSPSAKAFWANARVGVIGAGSWGTVLAQLVSRNCREVRLYARDETLVREMNSTRANPRYAAGMALSERVHAVQSYERVFEEGGVQALIWVLPSSVSRAEAAKVAPLMSGDEIVLHATKGIEPGSLKRMSEVLREELPVRRIGVVSGPNLAAEIARGEPAATTVASPFEEVIQAAHELLTSERFRVYSGHDVIGIEWAGVLKNILAIAAGAFDALQLGWNARALLIARGLAEMARFGVALGGKPESFLGLAGVGDLLATCSSPLSRNYRVGFRIAQGEPLDKILAELGSTAEGVRTAKSVWEHAQAQGIEMPITEGVYRLLYEKADLRQLLVSLMSRPALYDGF